MLVATDPYETLGVARSADADQIAAAYRHLMRRLHPDTGGQDSEERAKAVNEAYRVLSNESLRSGFDRDSSGPPEFPRSPDHSAGREHPSRGEVRFAMAEALIAVLPFVIRAVVGFSLAKLARGSSRVTRVVLAILVAVPLAHTVATATAAHPAGTAPSVIVPARTAPSPGSSSVSSAHEAPTNIGARTRKLDQIGTEMRVRLVEASAVLVPLLTELTARSTSAVAAFVNDDKKYSRG